MAIFRQYIAPLLILLIFLVALAAVSFRSFLPEGMSEPAPVDDLAWIEPPCSQSQSDSLSEFPLGLSLAFRDV